MLRLRIFLVGVVGTTAACASILGVDGEFVDQSPDGSATTDGAVDVALDVVADDASGAVDGADSSVVDAGADVVKDTGPPPCTGHICNGICLPGTTCAGCAQELYCAVDHTCVASCGSCGTGSGLIQCWACPDSGAQGSCEPAASAYCLGSAYAHCPCTDAAADCPAMNHVCVAGDCRTCGESQTDGRKCRSQTCEQSARACN